MRWLRLPELPPSFTSLTHLKSLDVSDCGLHALPESLVALPQLECLTATGNAGMRMPHALAQLRSLRLLNLSWSLWWGCDLNQLFGLCAELKVGGGCASYATAPRGLFCLCQRVKEGWGQQRCGACTGRGVPQQGV